MNKRTKKQLISDVQDIINSYKGKWGEYKSQHEIEEWFEVKNVQGFFGINSSNPDTLHIIFRGSDEKLDWKMNFRFRKVIIKELKAVNNELVTPYKNVNPKVKTHKGFTENWKLVRELVFDKIKEGKYKRVVVKGHSAGAATAIMAAIDIQYNLFSPHTDRVICIPIASPRVGNQAFVKSYNKRIPETIRIVNGEDFVTKVPYNVQGYFHVDSLLHIGYCNPFCWIPVIRIFGSFYHYPESYLKNLIKYYKKKEKRERVI